MFPVLELREITSLGMSPTIAADTLRLAIVNSTHQVDLEPYCDDKGGGALVVRIHGADVEVGSSIQKYLQARAEPGLHVHVVPVPRTALQLHLERNPISPDSILFNDEQTHRLALDVLAGRRDGHLVLATMACWVVRHFRDKA